MKRASISILLCIALGVSLLYSCKHDLPTPNVNNPNLPSIPKDTNQGLSDTALCFERDVLPIFISNCAKSGCHDAITQQKGYVFTSYATITSKKFKAGNLNDTELWEKITEQDHKDRMPPPPNTPLTITQQDIIKDWILRGAPNTTNCPSNCDTSSFKYAADIRPLIQKYCVGCHNATTVSGGYNYENYSGLIVPIQQGRLLGAINHQPGYSAMPKGGMKLNNCEIKKIEKWIANGAQNN